MKKCGNAKIMRPNPPCRQKNSRGRWDMVARRDKLVEADLTRREAASSIGGAVVSQREDRGRVVSTPKQPRVFLTAHDAARSVRGKWQEWRAAGVWLSKFHKPGTAFALPFDPDDYLWAGPVTLKLEIPEGREMYYRRGHYRRGVRKYLNQLKRGEKLPPVVLLYHEAWDWTMQDGNHRMEAIITHRAPTYEAFLGKPKRRKPIDEF